MADTNQTTNQVAMEELEIAHEGLEAPEPAAVDGADFLVWQRNLGARSAGADGDGDVDGADFLTWQRHKGAVGSDAEAGNLTLPGDGDRAAIAGDFDGDGDVDGRDFLMAQGGPKVMGPEADGSTVFEGVGTPVHSGLKAGASEVLMESVVSPRDAASGQASGLAFEDDDAGPSVLADLHGSSALEMPAAEAFDGDIDVDLDIDI